MRREAQSDSEPLLVKVDEVARRLGLGRSSVLKLMKTKELETVRIGRTTRVPTESVVAFVNKLRRVG